MGKTLGRSGLGNTYQGRPMRAIVTVRPAVQVKVWQQPEHRQLDPGHGAEVAAEHALVNRCLFGQAGKCLVSTRQCPALTGQLLCG